MGKSKMKKYLHKECKPKALSLGDTTKSQLIYLLQHELNEYEQAQENEDDRIEWKIFKAQLDLCNIYIENGDTYKAMYHFYLLGYYARRAEEHFSGTEVLEARQALLKKFDSELPFKLKEGYLKNLKEAVQKMALRLWESDDDQAVRVSKMAELVRNQIANENAPWLVEIRKELPKFSIPKAAQFKRWISEVAPPYAKKGGAPKT